jgi:hypothetical protein
MSPLAAPCPPSTEHSHFHILANDANKHESLQAAETRPNMSDSLTEIFTERDRPMEHK